MSNDRHRLWRIIGNNYAGMKAHAPDGYEPVVEVEIAGRGAPIRVGLVQTSPDIPWVMFDCNTEGRDEPDTAYPSDRYLFVRDDLVLGVEIRFVLESGVLTGFSYREGALDDDAAI